MHLVIMKGTWWPYSFALGVWDFWSNRQYHSAFHAKHHSSTCWFRSDSLLINHAEEYAPDMRLAQTRAKNSHFPQTTARESSCLSKLCNYQFIYMPHLPQLEPVGDKRGIVGDYIFNQHPFPRGKLILSNALLTWWGKGRAFDPVVKIQHLDCTMNDSTDVNVPTPWITFLRQYPF